MENQKRYHYFQAVLMAFYSGSLYRDVVKRWRGSGIFYLFLLLVAVWLVVTGVQSLKFNFLADQMAAAAVHKFPVVTVHDGQLSINEPVPYTIYDPETDKPLIIIDTSETYQPLADTGGAMMLLTREQVFLRQKTGDIQQHKLPKDLNLVFDKHTINTMATQAKRWFPVIYFSGALLCSFIYRLLQGLIYAGIVLLFANLCRVTLSYGAAFRVAMIAVTPAIVISVIFDVLSDPLPAMVMWLLYMLITFGYFILAVRSNKPQVAFPLTGDGC